MDNQNNVGRYRVTSQRLLPKFGSKANPIRAVATESPNGETRNSDEASKISVRQETLNVDQPVVLQNANSCYVQLMIS